VPGKEDSLEPEKDDVPETEDSLVAEKDDVQETEDSLVSEKDGVQETEDSVVSEKDDVPETEESLISEKDDVPETEDSLVSEKDGVQETEDSVVSEKDDVPETEESLISEKDDVPETEDSLVSEKDGVQETEDSVVSEKDDVPETEESLKPEKDDVPETDESLVSEKDDGPETEETLVPEKDNVQENEENVVPENKDAQKNTEKSEENEAFAKEGSQEKEENPAPKQEGVQESDEIPDGVLDLAQEEMDLPEDEGFPAENVNTRTIQLKHPDKLNKCMTYNKLVNEMTIVMSDCSEKDGTSTNDDLWEIPRAIIPVKSGEYIEERTDLFYLRHKATQLCIPVNPEYLDLPFDCHRYFGVGEAIADSFNGLVDCNSDFAAIFGTDKDSKLLYLQNSGCSHEWSKESDASDLGVVFMTYQHPVEDKRIVVWGESILLALTDEVEHFNFRTEWAFVDITDTVARESVFEGKSDIFGSLFDIAGGQNPVSPGKR